MNEKACTKCGAPIRKVDGCCGEFEIIYSCDCRNKKEDADK